MNLLFLGNNFLTMKDIFIKTTIDELIIRINNLSNSSQPKWGEMDVSQMLAHVNKATEMAFGGIKTKRMFIGRIIGKKILKKAIGNDRYLAKNSPTSPEIKIADKVAFDEEKQNLISLLQLFISDKAAEKLEGNVHPFFGKMTADQWNKLGYKHVDHHLRQFGV